MKKKSNRRGRPKSDRDKDGQIIRDGSELVRALIVLEDFNKARRDGKTVREARQFVVAEHNRKFPGACMSASLAARILAEFQPEDANEALLTSQHGDEIAFRFGPRPRIPRKPSGLSKIRFGEKSKPSA